MASRYSGLLLLALAENVLPHLGAFAVGAIHPWWPLSASSLQRRTQTLVAYIAPCDLSGRLITLSKATGKAQSVAPLTADQAVFRFAALFSL